MKKTLVFIFFVAAIATMVQAQTKNSLDVHYQFTTPPAAAALVDMPHYGSRIKQESISLSYYRGVSEMVDFGLFMSLTDAEYVSIKDLQSVEHKLAPTLGVQSKLSLNHAFGIGSDCVDLYVNGKLGGLFADGCRLTWGAGLGAQYFPLKHLGVSCEADLGQFLITTIGYLDVSNLQLNAGLTYRW